MVGEGSPMTAASSDSMSDFGPDSGGRRSRYARDPSSAPRALTPDRVRLLATAAEFGIVTLPQLARLMGAPPDRLHPKAVQRGMRALFDVGLVEVVPLPRALLAGPRDANDASLLHGSAPNAYVPTRAGLRLLAAQGVAPEGRAAKYGPRNGPFLRHELEVRDVRVWITLAARERPDGELRAWRDGADAAIGLGRDRPPVAARPDARFACGLGTLGGRDAVLVGLVEVDRGTERGEQRWREKLEAYGHLFAGGALKEATGYTSARVLVVCPDARRRDGLADLVAREASPALAGRFWMAERGVLDLADLRAPLWRQVGSTLLRPLVPPESR